MRMSALLIVLLLAVATVAGAGASATPAALTQPAPTSASPLSLESASTFDPLSPTHAPASVPAPVPRTSLTTDASELSDVDAASSHAQIDTSNPTSQPESQTTITISIRADQSAFWRIETQYALTNPNETRAFKQMARQYERDNIDIGPQITLFRTLQTEATAATDRRMQIRNVSYHGSVEDNRGTLALSFRWSNFAQEGQNETLLIGDVFKIPTDEADVQRTWMSVVTANQQIVIRPPNRYTVSRTSIPVQQRESAVVLTQPSDFEGDSGLEIRYSPVEEDSFPTALVAGAVLGLLGIIGILYGSRRYRTDNGDPGGTTDDTPPSPGPDSPPAVATDTESENKDKIDTPEEDSSVSEHTDASSSGMSDDSVSSVPSSTSTSPSASSSDSNSDTSPIDDAESTDTGSSLSGTETSSAQDDTIDTDTTDSSTTTESESETQSTEDSMPDISTDPALLSDEERIEQLLSRNGGRMRQASIVDKTGWSDAKVSQVLSVMAEENRVDKLRLGRENLISLPEESTTNTQTDDEQMSTD